MVHVNFGDRMVRVNVGQGTEGCMSYIRRSAAYLVLFTLIMQLWHMAHACLSNLAERLQEETCSRANNLWCTHTHASARKRPGSHSNTGFRFKRSRTGACETRGSGGSGYPVHAASVALPGPRGVYPCVRTQQS